MSRTYAFDGQATYICPDAREAHNEHGEGLPDGDGAGHSLHVVAFFKGDQEFQPPPCSCEKALEVHAVHEWAGGRRGALRHEPGRPPAHDSLFSDDNPDSRA